MTIPSRREILGVFFSFFFLFLIIGFLMEANALREYEESYDTVEYIDRAAGVPRCGGVSISQWNLTYYGEFGDYHTKCGYSTETYPGCGFFGQFSRTEHFCHKINTRARSVSIPEAFCDSNMDLEYCKGYYKRDEEVKGGGH